MLRELNAKIQQRVSENHSDIVIGVLSFLIKTHESFCGCEYCQMLPKYVEIRKQVTKYKRIARIVAFDDHIERSEYNWLYVRLDYQADQMKIEKDKLKSEAIGYLQ